MTENISYKRCICDICGKEEHISQSAILPKEWDKVIIGKKTYDVCLDCLVKVDIAIEDLKGVTNAEYHNVGEDYHKYMTNADRIRTMTDEELAELMDNASEYFHCETCKFRNLDGCGTEERCRPRILEWLKADIK